MSYDAEPNHAVCPRCNGEGYVFDDHDRELAEVADKCPQCEGDGWVYATSKPAEAARPQSESTTSEELYRAYEAGMDYGSGVPGAPDWDAWTASRPRERGDAT